MHVGHKVNGSALAPAVFYIWFVQSVV